MSSIHLGEEERDLESSKPLLRRPDSSNTDVAVPINCLIESLDYEIMDNELFEHDWRPRDKVHKWLYIFLRLAFSLLIGVATAFLGFFNNLSAENISGFKLLLISKLMVEQRFFVAFMVYLVCNLVLSTAAAVLCVYVAPAAAGSGIPEVKAYLNGVDAPSILTPSTLIAKIFGSIGGVAAGLIVGKEGPMVHAGACIASLLGQGGSTKYHMTWRWLRYFKNDRDRRDLVTCGSAAGVAAAFRAPIGGVLFALEEVASCWRTSLTWRSFSTTIAVVLVLRGLIGYCQSGNCGLFGEGGLIMFDVSSIVSITTYNILDIIVVIVLSTIGGFLSALYNHLIHKTLRIYGFVNRKGALCKILLAICVSLITSCLAFGLPWLAKCTPCPHHQGTQGHHYSATGRGGSLNKFQCPAGHYNNLALLFLNTNDDAIRNLFSGGTASEFPLPSLVLFFSAVYFLGVITYGIAIPAGLFVPVILAGAAYGRIMGTLLRSVCELDPGLFALLGAASFLGGTMRMTVSVCIILLELTNGLLVLPWVMMVILVSKTVADLLNEGIYDQIVEMKGFPFMKTHAEPCMRSLVARDVVSHPLVTLAGVEKVGTVVHQLRHTKHNGFPVVVDDDDAELCGLVLRSHLLMLLKRKMFTDERVRVEPAEAFRKFQPSDFDKAGSGKGVKLEDLDISEDEMEMYVDLHPVTNKSPYTVYDTMSLAKAATLFQQLGLRHLCVVPRTPRGSPIVGILTRQDFMLEHILKLYPDINNH